MFFISIGGRRVPPGEPERGFQKEEGGKIRISGCMVCGVSTYWYFGQWDIIDVKFSF